MSGCSKTKSVFGYLILFLILLYNQKSEALSNGIPQAEENGDGKVSSQNNQVLVSRILANASTPNFHELCSLDPGGSGPTRKTHKCCVYIASSRNYCARLNSIQAFMDINRDVSSISHLCFSYLILCAF